MITYALRIERNTVTVYPCDIPEEWPEGPLHTREEALRWAALVAKDTRREVREKGGSHA